METSNLYRVVRQNLPLAEHEHIFELVVIATAIDLGDGVPLPENHCVVDVEANLFEEKGLRETGACLRCVDGRVIDYPHNDPRAYAANRTDCSVEVG